jgi:Ran GTPase-activating protein (RanGAP) involved in mRNA processing and transport
LNKLLRLSQTLNELYLRYNGLMSIGGRAIFSAFLYNNALKVLDVSHNGLGGGSAMKVICETLRNKSCELTHLDLSYNHITANESAIL